MRAHDDLSRSHEIKDGPDRSFGFVLAVVFAFLASRPRVHGHPIRLIWAGGSAVVLAVTPVKASLLALRLRIEERAGSYWITESRPSPRR